MDNAGNVERLEIVSFGIDSLSLAGSLPTLYAQPGMALPNVALVDFADADPADTNADFQAAITWGEQEKVARKGVRSRFTQSSQFDAVIG